MDEKRIIKKIKNAPWFLIAILVFVILTFLLSLPPKYTNNQTNDLSEYLDLKDKANLCDREDEKIRQELIKIINEKNDIKTRLKVSQLRLNKINECIKILSMQKKFVEKNFDKFKENNLEPELEKNNIMVSIKLYDINVKELQNVIKTLKESDT
jgi:hypothetical protein